MIRGDTTNDRAEDVIINEWLRECSMIRDGFIWPDELGWVVVTMPGFTPRRPLTYDRQVVPPPLCAWVSPEATDNDIMFDRRHGNYRCHQNATRR